eukprot:CAMPEP_0198334716 /NCGR_PEP_ID=MMETSP1450-20131203/19816_1 /TAXON_ID=753684 ORGANISM="Madagascaria erythrocladiodes, Strain CCMP3234" /NCGR_SAMPLE_ID=MMETSP1450 /ASSEMBLY_ACC=CAM_ASM_001115 /LENGTH=32 /DNA_ID= /DNA_START= /DNA_END= /DNA_ORIENTATION=
MAGVRPCTSTSSSVSLSYAHTPRDAAALARFL